MTLGVFLLVTGFMFITTGVWVTFKAQTTEINVSVDASKERSTAASITHSDNYEKGLTFERFVVSLFNKEYFEIAEWRSDKSTEDGRFAKANLKPDLEMVFRNRASQKRFALECKYRSQYHKDGIKWSYPAQLERYQQFAKETLTPVFITLGVGGTPNNPHELFVIPLMEASSTFLSKEKLKKYSKRNNSSFYYDMTNGTLR